MGISSWIFTKIDKKKTSEIKRNQEKVAWRKREDINSKVG